MTRTIKRDFDLVWEAPGLRAYTRTVDGEDRLFLGGTASSTATDLYGDTILEAGQEMMAQKLRAKLDSGAPLTAWLNHSYKIPEDTLGKFTRAGLALRSEGGQTFVDLDIECEVLATNPRALAAYEQVKAGITHGWSIGCYFTEAEWSDDPDNPWGLDVTGVNLLEISLVGIPANQRSWATAAAELQARAARRALEIENDPEREAADVRALVLRSLFEPGEDVEPAATRDPQDGDAMSPDDVRDKITLAIACIKSGLQHGQETACTTDARAHGMCANSAGWLDQACAHLSAVIGADGGTAEPDGDENPASALSAGQTGDAVLLDVSDKIARAQAELDRLTSEVTAQAAALSAGAAQLDDVEKAIAAKQGELKALTDEIATAAATRLGRKTVGAGVSEPGTTGGNSPSVRPEAYARTAAEHAERLAREMTGVVNSDARLTAT